MIKRRRYLDFLKTWREKQVIKVVTGVRRCGKSTLFLQYIEDCRTAGIQEDQFIYINLEDLSNEELLDYHKLNQYILERLVKSGYSYVFLDEVQKCQGFEKVVDSLHLLKNVDVYITGSNSTLLSGELATFLSGRYIQIEMLPLSFAEFVSSRDPAEPLRESFNRYLTFGSFPYLTQLPDNRTIYNTYLEGIYNTILVKDVAAREGITDVSLLEDITRFLCSNIGSPVSAKRISGMINSSGRSISVNTVEKYVRALTESYFFYKTDRYDIKGGNLLKTLSKYYIADTGLRNFLLASESPEIGHLIENIVYLELKRRNFRVNVGKMSENEIDFVAMGDDRIEYYQVAASVLNSETLSRELLPFRKIPDNYPKFLLTLDDIPAYANHQGVKQIYLLDWLLQESDKLSDLSFKH